MKNTTLFILFVIMSTGVFAQVEKQILKELKAEQYDVLSEKMDRRIDLCINDEQEFLPKEEALTRIKAFNGENAISSWDIIHEGNSKGNTSKYSVAEVKTSSDTYRLMLYFSDGVITEIRFE